MFPEIVFKETGHINLLHHNTYRPMEVTNAVRLSHGRTVAVTFTLTHPTCESLNMRATVTLKKRNGQLYEVDVRKGSRSIPIIQCEVRQVEGVWVCTESTRLHRSFTHHLCVGCELWRFLVATRIDGRSIFKNCRNPILNSLLRFYHLLLQDLDRIFKITIGLISPGHY